MEVAIQTCSGCSMLTCEVRIPQLITVRYMTRRFLQNQFEMSWQSWQPCICTDSIYSNYPAGCQGHMQQAVSYAILIKNKATPPGIGHAVNSPPGGSLALYPFLKLNKVDQILAPNCAKLAPKGTQPESFGWCGGPFERKMHARLSTSQMSCAIPCFCCCDSAPWPAKTNFFAALLLVSVGTLHLAFI